MVAAGPPAIKKRNCYVFESGCRGWRETAATTPLNSALRRISSLPKITQATVKPTSPFSDRQRANGLFLEAKTAAGEEKCDVIWPATHDCDGFYSVPE